MATSPLIVVMGVTGSGKSTVAAALARHLGVAFCEGDVLHPASSIAKMHSGTPLDDADRGPWLTRVNFWLRAQQAGGVVACSALKRIYRDRLREGIGDRLAFVLLDPPSEVLASRLDARVGHFMPAALLGSQLEALERPTLDEHALRLTGGACVCTQVTLAASWLASRAFR